MQCLSRENTCQSTPTNFALPANFDLLHASTQELRQHYLPSRPPASNQQAVVHWLKLVQSIKHVACLAPGGLKATYHGHPVISTISCNNPPSGTTCNRNWTGYVAGNGTQPGFNDVYGDWNVQCINGANSPYGSLMTSWVGLGGDIVIMVAPFCRGLTPLAVIMAVRELTILKHIEKEIGIVESLPMSGDCISRLSLDNLISHGSNRILPEHNRPVFCYPLSIHPHAHLRTLRPL